ELCRRFQNVAVFRRELASALHDLGSLWQDEQRRLPEAIDLLRSAIAIERAELESGQGAADVRRQLAASCLSLAEALRLRGERTEASQLLEQGIDQAEQAQAGSSQDARIPPLLLALHWSLTATQVEQGDHAAAALAIEALVPMLDELGPTERAPALRRAAMYCMRCRRLAAADPSLGADERSSKVSTYARLAIGLLRDAVEQGLARAVLAADSEFAELHGDSTFGAVIGGS
ncbi:MAG: tetratricopeptide repeat protein, partial [Planctomycetota bacterium]